MKNRMLPRYARRVTGKAAIGLVATTILIAGCGPESSSDENAATDAAFRNAAQAAADCLEVQGWTASGPDPAVGGFGYTIGVGTDEGATEAMQDEASAALDACWERHAAATANRYYAGLELTGQARETKYAELVECLEDAGVTGVKVGDPEGVVGSAIGDNLEGVDCMQRFLWLVFGDGTSE